MARGEKKSDEALRKNANSNADTQEVKSLNDEQGCACAPDDGA